MCYEEMPIPEPGIGDVLVEVAASSFTPTELEWPSTWVDHSGRDRTPIVPGHELSGTVTALGYGTTGFEVGDAVYGLTDWYRDGTAAGFVAVEARNLAPKPTAVSHAEAASLPLAGLTAWQGLFAHGRLGRTQTVVVLGAGGGVGSLAVQLARDAGARVVAVAHDWAHRFLDGLGADVFVNAEDAKASDLEDADLLLDLVGNDLVDQCLPMLRTGGIVVSVVNPESTVAANYRFFVVEPDRAELMRLAHLVDTGRVRPVVGDVVDLPEAAARQLDLKADVGVPGKVVLQPARSG
jgi:NADPH:quinone reductase-like Zn-dependent oxidoreductase